MTFEELVFGPRGVLDGEQARVSFANGYGASIIRGYGSYGYEEGLYELAVLRDGALCCETPITDDVEGHLTEADVTRLLSEIEALPAFAVANANQD